MLAIIVLTLYHLIL